MASIGALTIELAVNVAKLQSDVEQIKQSLSRLGRVSSQLSASMVDTARAAYAQITSSAEASTRARIQASQEYVAAIQRHMKAVVAVSEAAAAKMSVQGKALSTLGIRPSESIKKDMAEVERAFSVLQTRYKDNADELQRIERAKTIAIGKLNRELAVEVENANKQQESSFAGTVRAILRWYAAYYVVSSAISSIGNALSASMQIVDEYNNAITEMAAVMTGMMAPDSRNLGERFYQSLQYATQLNQMIQEVDKNTRLTATDLRNITLEMMKQEVIVDTTNEKQVAAFTALANALAVVSGGYLNKEIQLRQEVRALLQGQLKDTAALSTMLAANNANWKEQVELHKKDGTIIEWIGDQLIGFISAQDRINISWEATKTTLSTIAERILRDGFDATFKNIIAGTQKLSEWAKTHQRELALLVDYGWSAIESAISKIAATLETTYNVVTRFSDEIKAASVALTTTFVAALVMSEAKMVALLHAVESVIKALRIMWVTQAGPIGAAVGLIYYMKERLSSPEAIKPQLEQLEALRAAAVKAKQPVADLDIQIDKLQKQLAEAESSGTSKFLPSDYAALSAMYDTATSKPSIVTRSGEDTKKATDQAARLKKIMDDLRLSAETFGGETSKWEDAIARVRHRYEEIKDMVAQGQIAPSKTQLSEIESLVNKNIAAIEADRIRASNIFAFEAAERESATQAEMLTIGRRRMQQEFAFERENQAAINQMKLELGQITQEELIRQQIEMESEGYRLLIRDLEQQLDDLGNEPGINTPEAAKKGLAVLEQLIAAREKLTALGQQTDLMIAQAANQDLAKQIQYYGDILGYEDALLALKLKRIDIEKQLIAQYDKQAAAIWAAQQAADAYSTAITKKREPAIKFLEGMSDLMKGMSSLYAEGSKDAKNFTAVAQGLLVIQKALAVANAVAAVANAAATNSWPASLVAMAQMAAAMGSLLATIGESLQGGGGGTTKEAYQATTVLGGASGEASQSIQNSLDILNDIEADSYAELVGIHADMKNLVFNLGVSAAQAAKGAYGIGYTASSTSGNALTSIASAAATGVSAITTSGKIAAVLQGVLTTGQTTGEAISIALAGTGPVGWGLLAISAIDLLTGGALTKGITSWISSSEKHVASSGFAISSGTITDIINNAITDQISGANYLNVATKTKTLGHVSRGVESYVEWWDQIAGGAQLERTWAAIYEGISNVLIAVATQIGDDQVLAQTMAYKFKDLMVNLADLNPDEYADAINAAINDVADTAVTTLFGALTDKFQQVGEGAFETITRLLSDLVAVRDSVELTRVSFGATGEAAFDLSESLVQLAGDLDTFTGWVSKYYDEFATDAQKQTDLFTVLVKSLSAYNMTLPATRSGYVALVEGLKAVNDTNSEAYVTLMRLSDMASQYYDMLEQAAEEALNAAKTALDAAFSAAKDAINAQYQEQLDALNAQLDAAKARVSDLASLVNALTRAKESMRLEDAKYMQGMYQWSVSKLQQYANQKVLPSTEQIEFLASYLTSADNAKYYATAVDYQRAYWSVFKNLSTLENRAKSALSAAEQTVKLLEEQIDFLSSWKDEQLTALDNLYNATLGVSTNVLSVADAIAAYQRAQAAATTTTTGSSWVASSDPIVNLYRALFGREPDVGGYTFWTDVYKAGTSLATIMELMKQSPEYTGHAYGGLVSGPSTGYWAQLHGTELVVSSRRGHPATVDMSEVLDELKAIRAELQNGNRDTSKIQRILARFDADGLPEVRNVA